MLKRLLAVTSCMVMLSVGLTTQAGAHPPDRFPASDTFTDVNPCTGLEVEITIDFMVSVHVHQNNVTVHLARSGSTSDGYTMHGVESYTENAGGVHGHFMDMWRGPGGSKFRVLGNFALNFNQEEVKVDTFSLTCIGRR